MATNVFGSPITNATLEWLPEYIGKTITRDDRAFEALSRRNAEGKNVQANEFVDKLKWHSGNGISTKCLIYNATGEPMKLLSYRNFYGHLGEAPFPMEIANGQWGAYLHVKRASVASGSAGAVVYRVVGADPSWQRDLAHCWSVAWGPWHRNQCYGEIRTENYFNSDNRWRELEQALYRTTDRNTVVSYGQFRISFSIGNSTTSVWQAIVQYGNRR